MEPQGELEKVVSRNQSKQQDKHTHIERVEGTEKESRNLSLFQKTDVPEN